MSHVQNSVSPSATRPNYSPGEERQLQPTHDIAQYLRDYARERPDVLALWCFGIGFVLGWKARPW